MLSELLIRSQRSEEALILLDTLSARADPAWLHWYRAQACEALGREEAATSHARLALEVDPDLEGARAFLLARETSRASGR